MHRSQSHSDNPKHTTVSEVFTKVLVTQGDMTAQAR